MNFTADYISLCKNDKVQGLRKKLELYDFYYVYRYADHRITKFDEDDIYIIDKALFETEEFILADEPDCIWLPTGDQLDQCMVDICKEKFDGYFQYEMCFITTEWYGTIRYWQKSKEYMKDDELMRYAIKIDENPLICKLKLLISLLEEE